MLDLQGTCESYAASSGVSPDLLTVTWKNESDFCFQGYGVLEENTRREEGALTLPVGQGKQVLHLFGQHW